MTLEVEYRNPLKKDNFPKKSKSSLIQKSEKFTVLHSLPETSIAPENRPGPKRTLVFQPSIFRWRLLLVSGRVLFRLWLHYYQANLQLLALEQQTAFGKPG